MAQNGLKVIGSRTDKQPVLPNQGRDVEKQLREDYEHASEDLESAIAMHLPGRVQSAYERFMTANERLERYFLGAGERQSRIRLRTV